MKLVKHHVCLLLGSNIEPEKNLPRSIDLLKKYLTILQTSSVWESQAIGSDSANILNAAVLALTTIDAINLKEQVFRPLEAQLGRVRTLDKNSPRTIDIDPILLDQQLVDPGLWRYAHRAVPVAEILPTYQSETGEYLRDAASRLARITPIWVRTDVSLSVFNYI
jgi:2-amino-4-hydroxy-6-hydroxymethyldihydropteridine diphosphokinase